MRRPHAWVNYDGIANVAKLVVAYVSEEREELQSIVRGATLFLPSMLDRSPHALNVQVG